MAALSEQGKTRGLFGNYELTLDLKASGAKENAFLSELLELLSASLSDGPQACGLVATTLEP